MYSCAAWVSAMAEQATDHDRLRLAPDDIPLLWGILDAHKQAQTERWPRLDRILFDLEVMMRKQETERGR